MSPEKYAEAGTEHAHQVALFIWCAQNAEKYPVLRWFHSIPNGGGRSLSQGGIIKAEGARKGVSDCFLPVSMCGYHGFYIEMKKPGGKPSPEQVEFGKFVTEQGYLFAIFDHWEKARDGLIWYLETP